MKKGFLNGSPFIRIQGGDRTIMGGLIDTADEESSIPITTTGTHLRRNPVGKASLDLIAASRRGREASNTTAIRC